METLSDFGAVSFFNVPTLTTGIYNSWISFDDLALSNRLAFILIIFIFSLFLIESFSRKKAKYHNSSASNWKTIEPKKLNGFKAVIATLFCFSLLFFPVILNYYQTTISYRLPSFDESRRRSWS